MLRRLQYFLILCFLWAFAAAGEGEGDRTEPRGDTPPPEEAAAEFGPDVQFLDLQWVLERVEQANLEVLLNREGMEAAIQRIYSERAGLFPTLDLRVGQSRSQFVNVGRGFDLPGTDPVSPPSNRFDARLEGNYSLIDTDRIAAFRSAKLGLELTEFQYESLLQDVMAAAVNTYLDHLRNLSTMEVIQANIERNASLLKLARDRLNSGVATQIDVTRAEVALARSEQNSLEQETVILESELRLKQILDLDLDTEITLDPIRDRLEEAPEMTEAVDLETLLENRAEYQGEQVQLERQILARNAAIWQRFPQISLFGNWGYVSDEAFSGQYEEAWAMGLQFSVPIFEGFSIRSDRLIAESNIREQELVIRQLEQQLGSEYRLQLQQVRSTFDQIKVAKKSRDLGMDEFRLATRRFEQGVADNTEVVDAQRNLAEAENNYIVALYRYGLARLNLARTLGDVRKILEVANEP